MRDSRRAHFSSCGGSEAIPAAHRVSLAYILSALTVFLAPLALFQLISDQTAAKTKMAPILKKGLFCCVSLRTCVLILGSVTLVSPPPSRPTEPRRPRPSHPFPSPALSQVGNLLTLSMFVVSLDVWLSEPEYHHHWNHTALSHELANAPGGLHPDVLAAIANATAGDPSHPWAHPAIEAEDYYEDGIDSEAMEELLERSPHCKYPASGRGSASVP